MGEFAAQNSDPRLGSVNWANWTDQASQLALIAAQARMLFPVQEMLPFQRQIRQQDLANSPAVGQSVVFQAEVPDDEAWRMIDLTVEHDDSTTHIFRWTYIPRFSGAGIRMIARKSVNMNTETPLYRSFSDETSASRFAPRGPNAVEFYSGDRIEIFDLTGATDADVITRMRIRYELIPLPLDVSLVNEFTTTTV